MGMVKIQLLSQATGVGPGSAVSPPAGEHQDFLRSYQAGMVGGTAATVNIEVSSDNRTWIIAAVLTLTANRAEGISSAVPWRFVRANVVAVSGGGLIDALLVVGG